MPQAAGKFETLIDFNLEIGESPVWDERRGVLWFVDILSPAVLGLELATRKVSTHAAETQATHHAVVSAEMEDEETVLDRLRELGYIE